MFIITLFEIIQSGNYVHCPKTVEWINCCMFKNGIGDYSNENEHITTVCYNLGKSHKCNVG